MLRETTEIQAVWHERPGFFASGMAKWVAVSAGPGGAVQVAESVAFPLDDEYVEEDSSGDYPYIRILRDEMDEGKRETVDRMLSEFVQVLEHDGWVQAGPGADWFNLRFVREVNS